MTRVVEIAAGLAILVAALGAVAPAADVARLGWLEGRWVGEKDGVSMDWLDAPGALHARVEGPQGGRTVSEEWVWTRAR